MIELPIPDISDGEILVRLEAGSICGSDKPYFLCDTDHPLLAAATVPLPPMLSLHELVGYIAQSRDESLKEGDRVLALPAIPHHGLGEYFVSRYDRAVKLPAGPADKLVVAQPLGTVVHACLKLQDVAGKTVVVLGQGPTGQLFTALLRHMGVDKLIAVDLLAERLRVSTLMGATDTIIGNSGSLVEIVESITDGAFADIAIEAVGTAETLNQGARLVKRNGTLLAFGLPSRLKYDFNIHDFFWNEGRLICSLGPTLDDFHTAVKMISDGAIDVGPLVTHHHPFTEAEAAFTRFVDRSDGAIKVVLQVGARGRGQGKIEWATGRG